MKKGRAKQEVMSENDPGHANGPDPIQTVQSVGPLLVVLLENELQIAIQRKCCDKLVHNASLFV